MKRHTKIITTFLLLAAAARGWGAVFSRVPSDLVRAVLGSDVTFQWSLAENLTSLPDFQALVFGLWRHGFVATYITTVTRNGQVIPNPDLKKEAPRLDGRVQWKGNLSKSLVAFQISDVRIQDQTDYGLLLNFGPFRHSPTDSVRLEVEDTSSMITALPSALQSLPIRARKGKNLTFHCEFRVAAEDEALYEGIAVGVWERGEIALTLMTVTKEYSIVMNPKLYKEGPEYSQRVRAHLSTNNSSNTSKVLVELAEVKESDERSYGCSMYFGPFREPLGSSVSVYVEGTNSSSNGLPFLTNDNDDTRTVRANEDVVLPCPVLSEVIQLDRTFKALYWSYCTSKNCSTIETKWSWMAGMTNSRTTKVVDKGPYNGRVNLTRNGTLILSNVQISDGTDYMCTVQRVNFTSAERYFVTLIVNATEPPSITNRSKDKVTVLEGKPLVLFCEAKGYPSPHFTWSKNGKLLPSSDNGTKFIIHETSKKDAGVYRCEASNSVGTVGYSFTVEITSKEGDRGKKLTPLTIALLSVGVAVVLLLVGCCVWRRKTADSRRGYATV